MRIDQRVHNNIVIVEPRGRLTVETELEFTAAIRGLLDTGWRRLVLNLADVPYIDSCGLGAIAQAYVSSWRRGGELKLLNVTDRNRHLLTITKLLTVLDVYDSEDDVERSFDDPSGAAICLSTTRETGTGPPERCILRHDG
jgi:anti-sigma B factor antagonist